MPNQVLVQERPGVPLRRMRTAYATSSSCTLLSLSWEHMQECRRMSPGIEMSVRNAVTVLKQKRPSLVSVWPPWTSCNDAQPATIDSMKHEISELRAEVSAMNELLRGLGRAAS